IMEAFSGFQGTRTYVFRAAGESGGLALRQLTSVTLRLEPTNTESEKSYAQVNLRLGKKFHVGTRTVQASADALNVLNTNAVKAANIALKYRDQGDKWWGRLPGTSADKECMAYMTKEFESLGLKVEHFPYVLPTDWRPTDFGDSYKTADGKTIELQTVFPASGTKATPPDGITAEAVWVGIGAGADFIG